MNLWPFRRRLRAEHLLEIDARIAAALAARREARVPRAQASRKGHNTRRAPILDRMRQMRAEMGMEG